MQGVLSYEERLQRVRQELREEREKHGVTCTRVQYWQSRAKELEARLQIYEGKQEEENTKGGGTDDACNVLGGHGSLARAGCDGGGEDHGSGVGEVTSAAEGARVCGEPLDVKH